MTKIIEQSRLLAVTNNSLIMETVEAALRDNHDFLLLDSAQLSRGIIPAVQQLKPDIILLDFKYDENQGYDTIDILASQFPTSAVVAILPEEEAQNSNRVILAGARAFLQYPFSQENLNITLRRVVELIARIPTTYVQAAAPAVASRPKNTFIVFSPKGGGGCTTIATNLAIALHKTLKEDVLLIDGKHIFGHVSLMLNLRTANSIADLIAHAGTLDPPLIKQVVIPHVSGIHVLPSPLSITEAQGIRPDDLYKVILALQSNYPNIIIDGGNHLNENIVTYMDSSDKIILVLNPNLASLRDVRQFYEISRSTLAYPTDKILLVLNQAGRKSDVKIEEIEKILHVKLAGTIPADDNLVLSSLNDGVPIINKKPSHDISKAFNKLAKLIADIISSANAAQTDTNTGLSTDILSKISRLG